MSSNIVQSGINTAYGAAYGLSGTDGIAASTITTILFDTLDYDTNSTYNTGTGAYTVPVTGFYDTSYLITTSSINAGSNMVAYLYLNGAIVATANGKNFSAGVSAVNVFLQDALYLQAGDQIEFKIFTDSAGGMNIGGDPKNNRFSIIKVG